MTGPIPLVRRELVLVMPPTAAAPPSPPEATDRWKVHRSPNWQSKPGPISEENRRNHPYQHHPNHLTLLFPLYRYEILVQTRTWSPAALSVADWGDK